MQVQMVMDKGVQCLYRGSMCSEVEGGASVAAKSDVKTEGWDRDALILNDHTHICHRESCERGRPDTVLHRFLGMLCMMRGGLERLCCRVPPARIYQGHVVSRMMSERLSMLGQACGEPMPPESWLPHA